MNTFGTNFRIALFGESHGQVIGITIDGVPAGIELKEPDFSEDLARRKSGTKGTTPRMEQDKPRIISGVYKGRTTGAPLTITFNNENTRSEDYSQFVLQPRPGHADWSANVKYDGFNDPRGGGQFSGRLTLPLVAAGVVAKKVLAGYGDISVDAAVGIFGGIPMEECTDPEGEADYVGYASYEDEKLPKEWQDALNRIIKEGDSLGGEVFCSVCGVPAGIGEPFFDSVESLISHAMFSIPGVRAIEFGDGIMAAFQKGSEHNDAFGNDMKPQSNHAGGVNGGITNGADINFGVVFKPTSSIAKVQKTYDLRSKTIAPLSIKGRHDTAFVLRTPVIVEAMTAIVLADLIHR